MKRLLLCAALLAIQFSVRAENIVFPAGDNVVLNVKARFGAKGDGVADDTAALQKALNAASEAGPKIVYLPDGVYKISDTLRWAGRQTRVVLQGQSENGTVIKLADRAHTFTNPLAPKEMIWTGTFPPQRFRNAIRNLTVDSGKGNAGAIGVRFNASNQGILREVTIRSGDGRGVIGLDMGYVSDVGPLMVKNLHVRGFDVGIYTAYGVAGQVLENVTLENQNFYGWINDGQAVSMRNLQTRLSVPALLNKRIGSFITLLDAQLQGENANVPAIINNAAMLARNVRTPGYKMAIDATQGGGRSEAALSVSEYTSQPAQSQFPGPARTLGLPVQETPEVPWDDPKTWVSAAQFAPDDAEYTDAKGRKQKTKDYTAALQKAIDSGATTIYFPTAGNYAILGKIYVRGKVRRIIGLENAFVTLSGINSSAGEWIIEDGEAPVVIIERFDFIYSNPLIRVRTKRPVVISSIPGARLQAGPGSNVFLEDVVTMLHLQKGANVWMRQFNTEYTDEEKNRIEGVEARPPFPGAKAEWPGNLNDGGNLWIFGIKTEGDGTILSTINGGQSEVLGGVIYANKNYNPDKKLFVSEDSAASYSIKEFVSRNQPFNSVVETRGGQTQTLKPVPGGTMMVLYSGIPGAAPPPEKTIEQPSPIGTGSGLKAEYFADANFGELKTTRTDATIDFDWANNNLAGLNAAFSVRWTGFIEPRVTGTYNFPLSAEGMRLMIDGRTVATSWHPPVRYRFGAMSLQAGRRYAVKLEYRAVGKEKTTDKVTFSWQPPGEGAAPVPTSQMYPATAAPPEVTLSATQSAIAESGAPLEIKLTRSGDLAQPLTVNLAPRVDAAALLAMKWAVRGSAVAGLDYEALPESITFAAGQRDATLRFAPLNDKQPAPERTAIFDLEFAPHFHARSGAVTIKIQDDDLPQPANGSGLKAEYFDDNAFKELKGSRVDAGVDFNWNIAAPLPGIVTKTDPRGPHGFSARWSGQIQPQYSETYKFQLDIGAYSAARLWINNQLVVDAWQKNALRSGTVDLKAGQKYDIKLEYDSQNFYDARVQLLWSSPSQWEQSVPATQLFPAP